MSRTALPMVAVGTLGASDGALGLLGLFGVAPALVVGLVAGGAIDRRPKRPLLVGADLVRAALVATIPVAATFGVLGMPQLLVVTAGVGAASALFQLADNAWLPSLVGRALLADANTRLETTEGVAEASSPLLAGALLTLLSPPLAFALDSAAYLWSAAMLGGIRTAGEPAPSGEADTVWTDLRAGFAACLGDPWLRPALVTEGITYFCGGFFLTLYVPMTMRELGLSALESGALIGVGGLGALAGAWLGAPLVRSLGTGRAMVSCLALGLCANLLIPLSLHAGRAAIPLLVTQQLVGDTFLGIYTIQAITLRQRVVPEALLGRAGAAFQVLGGIALAAGAGGSGFLAEAIGLPTTLALAAGGALVAIPILARSPLARMP